MWEGRLSDHGDKLTSVSNENNVIWKFVRNFCQFYYIDAQKLRLQMVTWETCTIQHSSEKVFPPLTEFPLQIATLTLMFLFTHVGGASPKCPQCSVFTATTDPKQA